MKYVWIFIALLLCSCTTNTLDPAQLPSQPLYVFAGKRAVPGYGNAEVTAVDRTTLQPIGTRSFVTSYIHAAIFDGQHIWFGYAGDNDIDMHKVAKLAPDFTNEQQFDTCVEPTSVHQDGDALIVLCTENGMIAKAMRINRATGQIEAQTEMLTKWNDMFFDQSALFHGELIIFGSGHWGDSSDLLGREMQVRDPKTLALIREIQLPPTIIGVEQFIIDGDNLYIPNLASKQAAQEGYPIIDMFRYHAGATTVEALPNIDRAPLNGVIVGNELYTLHNTWPNYGDKVRIYKTNLTTWAQTHWEYDIDIWNNINDIANVDGHIIIAKFESSDVKEQGLYELNPTTGELTQRSTIPGASLILDTRQP